MDRVLTEKIKMIMLNSGIDLVGFAPVSRWKNAPYLLSPQAILPESKVVIVGAMHITETWTELAGQPSPQDNSGPGGWHDHNSLLDRIAYRTARLINDAGYDAVPIASSNIWRYRAYKEIPSLFAPDISHIHASVAAGISEIGWSGLSINPEFGSRCRYVSIITSAPLVESPMYDGPALCDRCGECIRHCPSAALRKDLAKDPHTVEIGGKVFKYANKNIWRCAWAEHFNLDLDSKRLADADHVDEKMIIEEINKGALRGHERGVCQRVCVPPHLRVKGNDNFHQAWTNRRYPDNMPTLRKMRDDIEAMVTAKGVSLVSVGKIDRNAPESQIVIEQVPNVKSMMAFALEIPEYPHNDAGYYYAATMKLHHIMIQVERMVEELGYWAASAIDRKRIISCWSSDTEGKLTHLEWDVQKLAEQTKLGKVNADDLFETPEFGVRNIIAVLVTDADLPATPDVTGECNKPRYAKLTGRNLRRRLEAIADANLVTHFGVVKGETLDPVAAQLKKYFSDEELGASVVDTSGKPHGAWISEIRRKADNIKTPEDHLPGAKSVVVVGMYYLPAVIANAGLEKSKQIGAYAFQTYQTAYELEFAGFEMVQELHRMGYRARLSDNLLGIGSRVDTPRGELADARCNALEAFAAGLADIGASGAALTPGHGAHVRYITLITDAELPADEAFSDKTMCVKCGKCSSKCPMSAISGETFPLEIAGKSINYPVINRFRCDWSKRYSLCPEEGPALIGNNTKVEAPDGNVSIEQLAEACSQKDQVMKQRTCILESCLINCPAK